jgi:hypothetical protein
MLFSNSTLAGTADSVRIQFTLITCQAQQACQSFDAKYKVILDYGL